MLLLVGAALMIRTVQHLVAVDPGFDPDRVLTARVSIPRSAADPPSDGPAPLVVSARTLLDRVRALPGVTSASLVSDPPLSGLDSAVFYTAEGQGATNAQTMPRAYVHRALPDFFTTMGIPILQGRTFLDSELTPTSACRHRQRASRDAFLAGTGSDRQTHQAWPARVDEPVADHRRRRHAK